MDYKTRINIIKGNRSLKEFAELLDIPVTTLHTYLNGREPSVSFVNRLHEKLNVNPDWLITGKGSIYRNDVFSDEDASIKSIINFLKDSWPKWTQKERCWFEMHFRRNFPEFETWLINNHGRTD